MTTSESESVIVFTFSEGVSIDLDIFIGSVRVGQFIFDVSLNCSVHFATQVNYV